MRPRDAWPLLLALLLPVARAKDDPPQEQVSPASEAQRAWAAGVAKALGLELRAAHAVRHAGRAEQVEVNPGYQVEFARVTVGRRRYASAEEARGWAGGMSRVCASDPRFVTSANGITHVPGDPEWGPDSVPLLLERLDQAWPAGKEPPADLGARLGLPVGKELSRGADDERRVLAPAVPAWEGARVELPGLTLDRRACPDAAQADTLHGSHTLPVEGLRTITDLRGREHLVLRGELADPQLAARAIQAAWSGADPGPRVSVGVLSPTRTAGEVEDMAAAALRAGGSIYGAGANLLRLARENSEGDAKLEGDIRWKFLDAGVRNHVMVRKQEGLFCEARVTAASMLVVVGLTEEGHKREKAYLLALLAALGSELPPPSASFVELLDGKQ